MERGVRQGRQNIEFTGAEIKTRTEGCMKRQKQTENPSKRKSSKEIYSSQMER